MALINPSISETIEMTSPIQVVEGIPSTGLTAQFNVHQLKFASLANAEEFELLKENLVEIDIGNAINHLTEDGYLEVSVPVLGMLDLLGGEDTWANLAQPFASVMAINGYGAKLDVSTDNYFPRPDFVMATDILGNQYEILVGPQGQIELPQDGLGLFSILSKLTFMYGGEQILNGFGLSNIENVGAKANAIYLLLPPDKADSFETVINVTHLNHLNQRQVDFEHKVPLVVQEPNVDEGDLVNAQVQSIEKFENSALLRVDLEADHTLLNRKNPFDLKITFQDVGVNLEFTPGELSAIQNQGWQQDANHPLEFIKSFGLSEFGLTALTRNIFSEFDFTKALLSGDDFGISNYNGYNDFLVHSDAIGLVYDRILEGIVHKEIPGEFILSRVPDERIAELDLSYAPLDSHDMSVIDNLIQSFVDGNVGKIEQLYLSDWNTHDNSLGQESLFLTATSDGELPDHFVAAASIDNVDMSHYGPSLISDSTLNDISLPSMEEAMSLNHIFLPTETLKADISDFQGGELSTHFTLGTNHVATTIHYGDVIDFGEMGDVIEGFNITQDKLDLSQLLNTVEGLTPDKINAEVIGDNIKVSYTDSYGAEQPLATLLGAHSGPELHGDLPGFIVTDS